MYHVHVHRGCCHLAWARRTAHQHIRPHPHPHPHLHSRPHDPILYPRAGPPNCLIVRPHVLCACISRLILPRPALPWGLCQSIDSTPNNTFHSTCCSHLVDSRRNVLNGARTLPGPGSRPPPRVLVLLHGQDHPHVCPVLYACRARHPHATDLYTGGIVRTQIEPLRRCP